jgi:TolA-binding protein
VAARARFMVGEIAFEQKEHSEAIRHFFKAAYGYAYPEWQANALYEAGRCFEVRQQMKQATQTYREIIEKFPDSDKADRARRRLAELGE